MVGNTDGKAYGLNANELCVLEAVGRCSRGDNARGWYASMQALADAMPFVVSKPTVLRAVDKLLEQGLIVRRENMSLFVVQNEPSLVQNEPSLVQNEPISVQNEPKSTPLNNPPINNKNKMERNENIARATMHDAHQVPDPSFDDLLKIYKSKAGDYRIADAVLEDARRMWALYPEWKKRMLLMHIREGKWLKPRLDWTVSDFDPQPKNLGGSELGGQMLNNHTAKIACYNGSFGVYSLEDIKLFDLKEPKKKKDELR